MTKSIINYLLIMMVFMSGSLSAQNRIEDKAFEMIDERGEVYFEVYLNDKQNKKEQINELSKVISISGIEDYLLYAYANKQTFPKFLETGYHFDVLTPPSMLHQPLMLDVEAALERITWDYYPNYPAYVELMYQFEEDYPELCEVVSMYTLNSGHEILFVHINDNLGTDLDEPEFMYTSSIHGDELAGYVSTMHLIDYMLANYGTDDQITTIINSVDIWINPLANPDGTFKGGDNTVYGATRGNANGVDMNRNYPDFVDGPHPDGNAWQEETEAFMDFAEERNFVMSVNFHGGAEVANYPWDTWSVRHADTDWWELVCRQWADTVHNHAVSGYFTDLDNGVTNGYDWYSINGGRQDYMNYYHHCRELTLEMTGVKLPPASQLLNIWEYQYRSLINYMEQAIYGLSGIVTDSVTAEPVEARVFIIDHDKDESEVYSYLPSGVYHRPIKAGTYDIEYSAEGYHSKTIENVSVEDKETKLLNVALKPLSILAADFYANETNIQPESEIDFFDTSTGDLIVSWYWTFYGAEPATSSEQNPTGILYSETGKYTVELTVIDNNGASNTMVKENYIRVASDYILTDTAVYLCEGTFFDTGGETDNYMDDEDHTMTFISLLESGQLSASFTEFNIEGSDNCENDYLEIYDGTTTDAPLIGVYCADDLPGNVVATNIDGALTFHFHSNNSINETGWKAEISCDTGVGIVNNDIPVISIFPNPAKSLVKVESSSVIDQLYLFNLSGELIYKNEGFLNTIKLNIESLPSGIYILQINTSNRTVMKKLLVQ